MAVLMATILALAAPPASVATAMDCEVFAAVLAKGGGGEPHVIAKFTAPTLLPEIERYRELGVGEFEELKKSREGRTERLRTSPCNWKALARGRFRIEDWRADGFVRFSNVAYDAVMRTALVDVMWASVPATNRKNSDGDPLSPIAMSLTTRYLLRRSADGWAVQATFIVGASEL